MGQRTLWVVATIIAVGTLSVGLAKHWPSGSAPEVEQAGLQERIARLEEELSECRAQARPRRGQLSEAGTIASAPMHERTAQLGQPVKLASEPGSDARSARFDHGGAGDGALLSSDDPESSGKRGRGRFERFVEEAKLTPQQRETLLGAIEVEREKLAALRAEPTVDHEARRSAVKAIRGETNRAAKQVLDVDQFEQYQQRRHQASERRRARRDEAESP